MRYDDPARPTVACRPAYFDPTGKPIAALQGLTVEPFEEGWRLSLWLMVDRSGAAEFSTTVQLGQLEPMLSLFCNDPESFLSSYLGYAYRIPEALLPLAKPGVRKLTLEDLFDD